MKTHSNIHTHKQPAGQAKRQSLNAVTQRLLLLVVLLTAYPGYRQWRTWQQQTAIEAAAAQKQARKERIETLSKQASIGARNGDIATLEAAETELAQLDKSKMSFAFDVAAQTGQWPVMQVWFDKNWIQPGMLDRAFNFAVCYGHVDLIKTLLNKGADVNGGKGSEITPLHYAAMRDNLLVVRILLNAGADINAHDKSMTFVSNYKPGKVNPRKKAETYGWTPLMWAAKCGQAGVARLLLAHYADVTLKGDDGKTALSLAREYSYSDIAHLLTTAGATQ